MDSIIATQFVDFTESLSPQIPMKDYFEKEHAIHGHMVELCDLSKENAESVPTNICVNKEAEQDLDIIKSTPVKVISPRNRKGETKIEHITYDEILTDAMQKLQFCKKPFKTRAALNKTTQEPNIFKTPTTSIIKSSRSVGCHSVPNKPVQYSTACRSAKSDKDTLVKSDNIIVDKTKTLTSSLFKQDQDAAKDDTFKNTDVQENVQADVQVDDHENEKRAEEEHAEELTKQNEAENKIELHDKPRELMQDDNKQENDVDATAEKDNRGPNYKLRASVLTWQNGRRSLNKTRRGSNRFVSLAEAVSRFQNETPKRFRTRCNKDRTGVLQDALSKPTIQRLKPTIPISPALMSKNRTRAVTVLSQEEREKREMEEMKKNPIKANPVPANVLRGPVRPVIKTNVKKSTTLTTTAQNSSTSVTQQSEKSVTNTSARPKSCGMLQRDKTLKKNTVTKVLVSDPSGIIVEREEIPYFGLPTNNTVKNTTRVIPFSFEARNKDLQMKKEQRLKTLQEASQTKTEFHARPAPNFSKPPLTTPSPFTKQQKEKKRTIALVQQCPFSFEERDKNWSKRKEELAKQMLEGEKRMRVFRANPLPVFKPVRVRGVSKERLPVKEEKESSMDKCDDQENKEPNIVSVEKTQKNKDERRTKAACTTADKQKQLLELHSDKRARERREFDERIKRKEMEEEAKRLEDKRKQEENEKLIRAEQRKQAEVKARPIQTYKPLIIAKATKPLTEPQSPAFGNKYKLKQL